MQIFKAVLFVLAFLMALFTPCAHAQNLRLDKIVLPKGFKIEVFASDVPNARSMCLSPSGTLFVGSRNAGSVYALVDKNNDGKADEMHVVAKDLRMPNGVAFKNGSLYIAEISRVIRLDNIEKNLNTPPLTPQQIAEGAVTSAQNKGTTNKPFVVVSDKFPKDEHHGWKFIRFGPDDLLYVPVGAPCNVCERRDPYSSIMRMQPDGSNLEVFARGIRNTVGFDWQPGSNKLWFTDNGRDWLGDDLPPDELNYAPEKGMHFGFPYRYGDNVPDPEFGNKMPNEKFWSAPAMCLAPHVAALGMRFYTGKMFPQKYRNQIFIAEHGSWNRAKKIGYRISLVEVENGKAKSYSTFAQGWLQPGEDVWGRPVDVLVMPDGALLVSDDLGNAIYRITYADPSAAKAASPPSAKSKH